MTRRQLNMLYARLIKLGCVRQEYPSRQRLALPKELPISLKLK